MPNKNHRQCPIHGNIANETCLMCVDAFGLDPESAIKAEAAEAKRLNAEAKRAREVPSEP